jgi:hypothetical protein
MLFCEFGVISCVCPPTDGHLMIEKWLHLLKWNLCDVMSSHKQDATLYRKEMVYLLSHSC